MTKIVKYSEPTKSTGIVTTEHNQLEQVLQQETGIRVKDGDQEKVKAFLNREVSFAYTFKGLTKLTPFDLLLVIDELYNQITKHYPNLSTQEIKTAFSNGISHLYDERGNYNIGLGGSAFMFFIKHYNEDKKKLKNSHVARSRETQQEKQEQETLSQLLLKKHNETYQREFQLLCKEVEDQIKKRIRVDFSVLDHIEIEAITPFLIKKCNEMDCSLTDEQQEKLLLWVDQHETKCLKYQSRLIFEILMYNLFKKKLDIKDDVLFIVFTKPNE